MSREEERGPCNPELMWRQCQRCPVLNAAFFFLLLGFGNCTINALKQAVLRVPSMPTVHWVPGLEGQGDFRSEERGSPLALLTEQRF